MVSSLVFLLFSASCKQEQALPQSEHFSLEQLSDGVWALIHKPGGEAICNAGIIDLGNETLVFDCFLTPKAANDLKTAAETLTGRPVTYVVNSHYHNDHIRGNQVFDEETVIISTNRIRELIETHEPEEIRSEKEYVPGWLADLEKEYSETTDSTRKLELMMWIGYTRGMLESHPILETVLPDSTFAGELIISGTKRSVKLMEYQNAHTENDLVLLLEDEKILFASDLLFVGCHPYLAQGDPFHLIEVLEQLKRMNCNTIVPGHGPIGGNSDIDRLISYIEQVEQVARVYISQGKTAEQISEEDIPAAYKSWLFPNFFKYNLGYMLRYSATEQTE